MKRLLLTSIVALVCSVGFARKLVTATVTIDKITYKIEQEEAYVYEADKDIEVANILSSVTYKDKTYPVTRISSTFRVKLGSFHHAFGGCKKLKSVSIPNSIKEISDFAFERCENLQEISIPNSVKKIEKHAFSKSGLVKVIVPDLPIDIFKGTWKLGGETTDGSSFGGCNKIAEVRSHNGSIPLWFLPYLPEDCTFILAQKYQQIGNNNMYAQHVQQTPVQNVPASQPVKKPSSDVDVNLPSNASDNDNTFAVIIANENYQEEVNVDYALNDGEMFKEYCHKVLGLPEDNVHIRKDATLNNIKAEISWMQQVAKAYNGQARFVVFYAGHGIPDEASKAAYLLPVDGKGSMLDTGYSLAKLSWAICQQNA